MSHNPKEAEKEMEKAIFISADCWLKVFDFLSPFQLGLGIAMISRRFDRRVDEHFKTRKWKLGEMEIRRKFGENGTNEMEIVNYFNWDSLPIPQNPLPNKVIGFRSISIDFFDQNVLTFLRRFHRFFSVCTTTSLYITTQNIRILEFAVLNIWPMLKDSIHEICWNSIVFSQMRQLAPSILCNYSSLRIVTFYDAILPAFPPDDSANASDGQAVAKWLFSLRPDSSSKVLICYKNSAVEQQWLATVEQIKAAFSIASSPVNFVIYVYFPPSSSLAAVVPFELTNEFTGEKLALSQGNAGNQHGFMIIRCPIAAEDEKKVAKAVNELFVGRKNNKIDIFIEDGMVDDSLLDSLPLASSDH